MTQAQRETIGVALDPMLSPDEPLGPHALDLLATALAANSDDQLRASQVVTEAISTRRLDSAALGRWIAGAMRDAQVPDRWADGLRDVAATGPLHAHELQRLLEATLAELGDDRLKLARFVDLLRTVAQDADARVTDKRARAWLEAAPSGSRLSTHAQAALGVTGDGARRSVLAAKLAREAEDRQRRRWSVDQPESPD
jgi:hypothetical protein